jgi:DNA polymerase III subunit delta'
MKGKTDEFNRIAGHRDAIARFRHQLVSGKLSHAYLLVGEAMVGKTSLARALARSLLPQARLEQHPDYWEDDRSESLKLDEVRALSGRQPEHHSQSLQAFLANKPLLGQYRVAVLANAGRLDGSVQGILLKTLEEPFPGRVIVLTSPSLSPFIVLPTVASRCQRVMLHAVHEEEIKKLLEQRGVADERTRSLAQLARGRPGWAIRAMGDDSVLERSQEWTGRFEEVSGAPADVALRVAADLDETARRWRRDDRAGTSGVRLESPIMLAVAAWQVRLRELMTTSAGPGLASWARLLERTYELVGQLEQNVNPRLALEVFLLEAGRASNLRTCDK